jgi:predicted metalloprotease
MATIVNTSTPSDSGSNSGNGLMNLVGIIILLLVVVLFFYYGIPALRSATRGPSVTVPDQIDVNINTPTNPSQ